MARAIGATSGQWAVGARWRTETSENKNSHENTFQLHSPPPNNHRYILVTPRLPLHTTMSYYGQQQPPPAYGYAPPQQQSLPPGADPQLFAYFSSVDKDRSGQLSNVELKQALFNSDGTTHRYMLFFLFLLRFISSPITFLTLR